MSLWIFKFQKNIYQTATGISGEGEGTLCKGINFLSFVYTVIFKNHYKNKGPSFLKGKNCKNDQIHKGRCNAHSKKYHIINNINVPACDNMLQSYLLRKWLQS